MWGPGSGLLAGNAQLHWSCSTDPRFLLRGESRRKDSQTLLSSLKAHSSEGAVFSWPLGVGVGSPRSTSCCVGGSKARIPRCWVRGSVWEWGEPWQLLSLHRRCWRPGILGGQEPVSGSLSKGRGCQTPK